MIREQFRRGNADSGDNQDETGAGGGLTEVCPAWALDWRCKSFTGRVGSNREPEATARRAVRRETHFLAP